MFFGDRSLEKEGSQNCVQHDTPWTDFSLTPEHLFCTMIHITNEQNYGTILFLYTE
jgi:hypothetical protein